MITRVPFPLVVTIVAICSLAVAIGQYFTTRRRLQRRLRDRVPVRAACFGEHFFEDQTEAEIATFVLRQMEDLTGEEFTGAAPDDSFNDDLLLDELDSVANVELITAVEERFAVSISDSEAAVVHTVRHLVKLVRSKLAR